MWSDLEVFHVVAQPKAYFGGFGREDLIEAPAWWCSILHRAKS